MNDLIDRQKAIEKFEEYVGLSKASCDAHHMILSILRSMPSAQPERKKGKWIEVYGYATPGGDPVWKCSECGKGMHVYGIEAPSYNRDYADGQWVACPNCGAIMEDI